MTHGAVAALHGFGRDRRGGSNLASVRRGVPGGQAKERVCVRANGTGNVAVEVASSAQTGEAPDPDVGSHGFCARRTR